MKKILLLTLSLGFMALNINAQNGTITNENLQKIKKSYDRNNSSTIAISNAVRNNSIKDLALDKQSAKKVDHLFKYRVDVHGITNQKQSGRCWMFTGLNVLRPKVIKNLNLSSFEFSTNYLYFYDILEKSNLFLEGVIATADKKMDTKDVEFFFRSPVNDGGVWNSLVNLISKYGVVPKNVMPETNSSENTSLMMRLLKTKLREDGLILRDMAAKKAKNIEDKKIEMLGEVYRILAINLGEPVEKFTWRYKDKDGKISELKEYTPKSFVKEAIPELNFDNYVMLMNDPSREYYKLYEIKLDRNIQEGINWKFINLPSAELKKFAMESIKNNEAMYASCDVGKQLDVKDGVLDVNNYNYSALFGVKFGMDKKQRIITHESGSTHGMALIAVDVDKNEKPTYWQFENSWGTDRGHNGYLTFTDKWFDEYMFRVVVLKKFIDTKTLKILEQKPIMLPPWDPMFQSDN